MSRTAGPVADGLVSLSEAVTISFVARCACRGAHQYCRGCGGWFRWLGPRRSDLADGMGRGSFGRLVTCRDQGFRVDPASSAETIVSTRYVAGCPVGCETA